MKLFHLADLHIGKTVNGFSLLEDQQEILMQVLKEIDRHQPQGLMIAGDLYDKPLPSGGAVSLFDDFLTAVSQKGVTVFLISGNHDSPERLEFGSRILAGKDIHIAGVFQGEMKEVLLEDEYGPMYFHLLPFVRPAHVRPFFPEEKIENYTDAIRVIINKNSLPKEERKVLLAHQFVLPPGGEIERSESETEPVGGINAISSGLFEEYDYVALGHLHKPQKVGRKEVRYGGSPLKYSFSEWKHQKAITVVELKHKGECEITSLPFTPIRDMRKIKGPFEKITEEAMILQGNPLDFLHVTLTDEEEIVDAIGKLRHFYPNIMELDFDNTRTRYAGKTIHQADVKKKDPFLLFEAFFKEQNGQELSAGQQKIVYDLLKKEEGDL
ncbi:MAG: exonuclease SbcCD subunit D [Clostridiales bacterium]|nr:exonuclease SbcCD subunit D [Clostridiales bacterium]